MRLNQRLLLSPEADLAQASPEAAFLWFWQRLQIAPEIFRAGAPGIFFGGDSFGEAGVTLFVVDDLGEKFGAGACNG